MLDPYTVVQLSRIRQEEILKQAGALSDIRPLPLWPLARWFQSLRDKLVSLAMPRRRRISRSGG
jgi:hypothetical protein